MNPQMQYGGDVIQRANYALEHGTETLSKCVQKTINKILESLTSMSASVCGDTAGVLLLSAVKYFFCLIFQGKKTICTAKL